MDAMISVLGEAIVRSVSVETCGLCRWCHRAHQRGQDSNDSAGSSDQRIAQWRDHCVTRQHEATLDGHSDTGFALAVSSAGLYSTDRDRTNCVWALGTFQSKPGQRQRA